MPEFRGRIMVNREIKFRAWDKEQKYMRDWNNLRETGYNIDWFRDNAKEDKPNDIWTDPDFTLMQYTGLKDKNGKEIYEGDILRVGEGIMFPALLTVKWLGFGFKLTAPAYVNSIENSTPAENLKVIGNIWENPELLT